MLNIFMAQKEYYIALGVFLIVGFICEFARWLMMRKLLNAAKSIKESENHSLIKQMKLGYTNAYKLNYDVNNTGAFIEKYLCRYKMGKISLSFISSIDEKMILLCGISCLLAIMQIVISGKSTENIIFVTGFGVLSVFVLKLFASFFSVDEMHRRFMVLMEDYFENVLKNRLSNHKKDNRKIIAMEERFPKTPKTTEGQAAFVKPQADSQTAAAKSSEEAIVEEIIKEFFP